MTKNPEFSMSNFPHGALVAQNFLKSLRHKTLTTSQHMVLALVLLKTFNC